MERLLGQARVILEEPNLDPQDKRGIEATITFMQSIIPKEPRIQEDRVLRARRSIETIYPLTQTAGTALDGVFQKLVDLKTDTCPSLLLLSELSNARYASGKILRDLTPDIGRFVGYLNDLYNEEVGKGKEGKGGSDFERDLLEIATISRDEAQDFQKFATGTRELLLGALVHAERSNHSLSPFGITSSRARGVVVQ